MSSAQSRLRIRTPQACERCRRSKTKCNGVKPQCKGCLKRKAVCSWPEGPLTPSTETFFAPTSSHEQEPQIANVSEPSTQSLSDTLDISSVAATCSILSAPLLLQRLFNIFFERHHDAEFCSFLHKPSLDILTLHNQSPFLVASIVTLASLYITTDEAQTEWGYETPSIVSNKYASLAKSYAYSMYDEPSIYTTQAFLILAVREFLTWSNIKAYMYAGTALRMAQSLNLNVEVGQRYSIRQKEIRRRTFWACFMVDRLISYSCNKPFTLRFQSASIQLPCPENVFAFDEVYAGFTVDDITLHASRVSQVGIMPFFIVMVRLWGDMALMHVSGGRRRPKSNGPDCPHGEFHLCDTAIENFRSSLPASLSWSPQNYKLYLVTGQAQAYVNLLFLLHHSKSVMHQEYLPQLDSQYSLDPGSTGAVFYDSAGISLDYDYENITKSCIININVITEMALTLNNGSEKDRQLLQSVFAANAILTASAVQLWILYTQTCYACPKHVALANAEKLRQIIKSWQPQWRVATAWIETLEMLYKLYVYSYGKVVESDLDCWDIGTDDIDDCLELFGEVVDENGGHPITSDVGGVSDPSIVCRQRLYDKIRSILVNPLLATDVKKRNLRIFSRTLWQHMWIYGPTDGVGDDFMILGSIMGEPACVMLNMPFQDLIPDN